MNRRFLCCLLIVLGIAAPIFARDVEIYVEDSDLEIPLEGALIRSWDGTEFTCDEEGRAVISVPDDRQVVIQAAYPGYENGRLVVTTGGDHFSLGLRLSGIMENRELVIEASRPGVSESRTGRSVAITEKEIARTAEIGIIEDVMTSIKLLPGVGYTGMFNAQPSIRGGDPGDLTAVLDGYYIEQPYHWGGGFSIFDPRMVQSAQLSHGVFSSRYGHTISGLLEISSKKPDPTETELELGLSTSVANLGLSFPILGRGGIMLMGKVTYYDPFIWAAKQASKQIESLEIINAITTAPYIRSMALSGNYRLSHDLEFTLNGFFGIDGVGALYENINTANGYGSRTDMKFIWTNYQGFGIAGLTYNPRSDMVLKASAGGGSFRTEMDGAITYNILNVAYSDRFKEKYPALNPGSSYSFIGAEKYASANTSVSFQGRLDYDWDLGPVLPGFLFAAGVQELYSKQINESDFRIRQESKNENFRDQYPQADYINFPLVYSIRSENQGYATSPYALMEYTSPGKFFGAELGLRLDHLYYRGKGFEVATRPVLNPRLNMDFNVLKNYGLIESLMFTAGTGLFSSTNDVISLLEEKYITDGFEFKPNRSVTTVIGSKVQFPLGISFNIEGYYKHVYDRTYITIDPNPDSTNADVHFNGEGRIWGFDFMLQKLESRYLDGWISYSFNYARYREPDALTSNINLQGNSVQNGWYYPSFHRFHNFNLILNFKPRRQFNISARFGFASGTPLNVIDGSPEPYTVQVVNAEGGSMMIQKWKRSSHRDDENRTTWSFPLDLKFSLYRFNPKGKVQTEIYIAIENVLSLVYRPKGNTTFNSYTGQEDTGSNAASYGIPIPVPSFGFKWSY
ncbi:hypothetical protein AGMMS50268_10500 [Spirochaetia bacterium]|nr:hypothetical protein AGMMS50268_10500 [Spirochaetia bacterium]